MLKKNTEFLWLPQHSANFKAIVQELCSPKLLKYYDSTKKLYLEVNASQKAIGMALMQSVQNEHESEAIDGQQENQVEASINDWGKTIIPNDLLPVPHGSKTLTDAEGKYANIECELLCVVARIEKFHTFCYGRSTIILSDHKPLTSIVRRDLVNAPPRLQRLLLHLQKYDVTIWYKPGKSMIFADHLSQNVDVETSKVPTVPNLDLKVSTLELNASPSKLELIKQESECDPQMLMLKELIIQGWPKDIKQCPLPLHSYWNYRDELSIVDGIVVKGSCIIISIKYRPELLSLLHDDSHLGRDKCIQCAKGSIYWPSITEDIKSIINKCEKCLAYCRCNQKRTVHTYRYSSSGMEDSHNRSIYVSRQNIHSDHRSIFTFSSS